MSSGSTPSPLIFPVSELCPPRNVHSVPQIRGQPLSFRRISLPTTPSQQYRESMISVASFVSMPEDREVQTHSTTAVIRNMHPTRDSGSHTPTTHSPERWGGHVLMKPINDATLSKRRKVIEEFYDTERTYVEGLELIYSHFLTPIIASLDTSEPLLDRSSLASVFHNFIDIWNLHRSFFSSLTILLTTSRIPLSTSTDNRYFDLQPSLSQLLLSHFPYLALYNPFVTAFPTAISSLTDLITSPSSTRPNPNYSAAFTTYLARQESDPRCGKLKLRDWLLTIVQRCPRYLLLLKDLIACTDEKDPEYTQFTKVQGLVSKITLSLNTSLRTHAQTLALLSLQRATPSLPFQLIVPGRTLLKRGSLLRIERSGQPREREFLLFSDCLTWLAREEAERAQWKSDWGIGRSGRGAGYTESGPIMDNVTSMPEKPGFSDRRRNLQSQNESEDETPPVKVQNGRSDADQQETSPSTPTRATGRNRPRKSYHPPSSMISRTNASSSGDERWIYKGRIDLVDLEVVVTPAREEGEERRFEILSPEESFVLYSGTGEDKDEWCSEIRQAKAQLLSSLNVMHPNSTLTSSSSTNHLRRSLQALPFPPTDERVVTYRFDKNDRKKAKGKGKGKEREPSERRRKVEHWVPAIWISDEETSECMRCGKSFGWRRRRHHCRLCGRCVCASCSGRTFFISDTQAKDDPSKPARACDACYETVFPIIDAVPGAPPDVAGTIQKQDIDFFLDLNSLPSRLSVPSLHVTTTPQALMAIKRRSSSPRNHFPDSPGQCGKARPLQTARTRSYSQLLYDFEQNKHERSDVPDLSLVEEGDGRANESVDRDDGDLDRQSSLISMNGQASSPSKEDATRRHRFSLPAMALQTTNVMARTSAVFDNDEPREDGAVRPNKANKRFSLVLGGRQHGYNGMRGQIEAIGDIASGAAGTEPELMKSIAAGKLGEILAWKTE